MNQHILCHFSLQIKEKYFEFSFQPGVTNFEDIYAALDQFKKEIDILQEKALEADAKLKAEKAESEAAQAEPVEAAVEPEVVQ